MKTSKLIYASLILMIGLLFQNCKHDTPIVVVPVETAQQLFDKADALNGAKLYDKWYQSSAPNVVGTDFVAPVDATIAMSDVTNYGNFYRCKQCHGWDQLANTGAYINRGPRTNRPDVSSQPLTDAINVDDIQTVFDYIKHVGGAPVSAARTADGTDPSLGGNDMPDFSKILTDSQIWDLVKFLKTRRIDTSLLYDLTTTGTYPTGSKTFSNIGKDGDAAAGDAFFAANCALCHGADGTNLNIEGYGLGENGRLKPYEIQHHILNGTLGTVMVGAPNATISDVKNLLKALQNETKYPNLTLTQAQLDQQAFDAADALVGARLFDKWWITGNATIAGTGFTTPVDATIDMADVTNYGDFYRCKQCHGWDQLANTGAYINRGPKVGRPDVSSMPLTEAIDNDPIGTVFEDIQHMGGRLVDPTKTADGTNPSLGGNAMPDFSKIFTDAQIWDLVKFLKTRRIDTSLLYDITTTGTYPTGSRTFSNIGKDGDAAAGDTFFANNCAACHGADGNTLNIENFGLGQNGRLKPYEIQHHVLNGTLGSIMQGVPNATISDVKNLLKALQNTTKYPDLVVL